MKKVLQVLCVVLIAATLMFGMRWYRYVTSAETPYDEVGITLNGYMPGPLRSWGCHKLQERFPGQLPPYGCAAADGRSWA
ncbi:hypothetical protein [Sphingomonas sp. LM7]|uniref:hypothetical protein n=1 Tax=Sphingomonas sp. LM7 TaxID=1938607 RepID=UPI000983D5F7|nr:hypothetical protein [Sphingomonas sp. LM7]AQR74252.1 hypothetical protein BXU08_11850 [Sphingomonas sp. LM7]